MEISRSLPNTDSAPDSSPAGESEFTASLPFAAREHQGHGGDDAEQEEAEAELRQILTDDAEEALEDSKLVQNRARRLAEQMPHKHLQIVDDNFTDFSRGAGSAIVGGPAGDDIDADS